MRKLLYIFVLIGILFSCDKNEFDVQHKGDGISSGEVKISFSALLPENPVSTKTLGEIPNESINNLYLIVFDENGMLVETREAELLESVEHSDHSGEKKYSVTLTLTEKKRIIHFVANCPIDQVVYGHEASVIGNMYVENGDIAFWARIEVDELVMGKDANGNPTFLTEVDKFKCVPMLRNYAQLTITNDASNFRVEGFLIYNTTRRGTIAPYNSYGNPVGFQNFLYIDENNTLKKYNYPQLYNLPYYGHALTSTQLITTVPTEFNTQTCEVLVYRWEDTDGKRLTKPLEQTVTGYGPVYLYERKISVKQGDEALWRESPSHLIIKGKFDSDKDESFDDESTSFYKVDLTRKIDGVPQYYNILRNFHYNFTIHEVHSKGYNSLAEAVAGSTSNNLSGSASTSKFDNISDQKGRLWVSYTTKTIVGGNTLEFYYKYVPDLSSSNSSQVANDLLSSNILTGIKFENLDGSVISGYTISQHDETEGPWAGYRKVTFDINAVSDLTEEQIFTIKAVNGNSDSDAEVLSRDVHLILRKPYVMLVECNPQKVGNTIGENILVNILIPDDLTDNLFPLDLNIESDKRSLSPDQEAENNVLPVVSGNSIIPSNNGSYSFYYVKTINSMDEYKSLESRDVNGKSYKLVPTYWITNRADNASYVVVQNEYFDYGYDYWINYDNQVLDNPFAYFSNLKLSDIPSIAGENVTFTFSYNEDVAVGVPVKMTFVGLKASSDVSDSRLILNSSNEGTGTYVYTFTPAANEEVTNTITLETLKPRGNISVVLEAESYGYKSTNISNNKRPFYKFYGRFVTDGPLAPDANTPVDYKFNVGYAVEEITITLNGLIPASATNGKSNLVEVANGVYTYSPNGITGDVTLSLVTSNTSTISGTKDCSVTLSDGNEYYETETKSIKQIGKQNYTATLTFDNTEKRVSSTTQTQVWKENDIIFTINKNTSTSNVSSRNYNPIRIYSGQNVIISVPEGGVITKIVFTCNSNTYANNLKTSIGDSATINNTQVTVNLSGTSSQYTISSLSGEVRLNSIIVTYEK